MNYLQNALLKGLADDVLEQLYPYLPILSGKIIALSTYGNSMWDDCIGWTSFSLVANFVGTQDAPFVVTEYGTVSLVEEPVLVTRPIRREASKVSFNHEWFTKAKRVTSIIDYYKEQLISKARAWDEKVAAYIVYGNPYLGIPGLLQGSGIPLITSTVNFSTATPEACVVEMVRIITLVANNTDNLFRPSLVGIPQLLFNILNNKTFNTNTTESVLQVIIERLKTAAGYNNAGDPEISITSVPQFNSNKLMTVLPNDANLIGAAFWDLEEFDSPTNTEYMEDGNLRTLASSHTGGVCGVVSKRPSSGLICFTTF